MNAHMGIYVYFVYNVWMLRNAGSIITVRRRRCDDDVVYAALMRKIQTAREHAEREHLKKSVSPVWLRNHQSTTAHHRDEGEKEVVLCSFAIYSVRKTLLYTQRC